MIIEGLAGLGVIAFVVSVIVQMTKGIKPINKVPTELYVIIVSMIVSFCNLAIEGTVLTLAVGCATFINAFLIAFISIYGYKEFLSMYDRFVTKEEK